MVLSEKATRVGSHKPKINKMAMVKYIRTQEGKIIAFPTYISHADYLEYCPVSAGFIEISHNENGRLEWKCFGNSISLGLESKEAEDTLLLHQQIGIDQLQQSFF